MFIKTTAIKKILKLRKRIKAIPGGTSAGKTFGILPILIDIACKRPDAEISVIAESIPHLKRGALKDFKKIMKETGRWIDDHFHKTDRKYTFSSGSFIEFFSPESVLGSRRTHLYINECNYITFEDYHQLSIRTSEEIYLDWNPSNEFWANTEVMSDKDCDTLTLTYLDNEALSPAIINELKKAEAKALAGDPYWINWWNVYGLGKMGTLEGVIFGRFTAINEFPSDCKWVCYGMDFGFTNDPTTLIKVGQKGDNIYLQQMVYQNGLTNNDISNLMKTLNIGRGEIVADSAEPKSIEELRRMGWNISGAEKKTVVFGIDLMQRYNYFITSESIDLIREWRGYSWKKDKSTNKHFNEPVDILNHCIDPIRYVMVKKINRSIGGPGINVTRFRK